MRRTSLKVVSNLFRIVKIKSDLLDPRVASKNKNLTKIIRHMLTRLHLNPHFHSVYNFYNHVYQVLE